MYDFSNFFQRATGNWPYPYQTRLALDDAMPDIIDLPTGSGKTEAAVISVWLWGRVFGHRTTPRRLVYCLPRRSLVDQTVQRVRCWVKNLGLEDRIRVSQIMGGYHEWNVETEPEREYILIGTQDMLLSGALNRSYGKNFNTWPMHFALLNNDCLWVMDEVQIMENGLPTSRQLDAFRSQFGTYGPHHSIWISATINMQWLQTPDSGMPERVFRLTGDEMRKGHLGKRNLACKTVRKTDISVSKRYAPDISRRLLELHCSGTPTAIIVNTVQRAQDIYTEIKKSGVTCILVHSRFRAAERRAINERISKIGKSDDIIIVSTQVLEAGVDISVRTLITEIAPWASMVQRFGRCNRGAEYDKSDIIWVDIKSEKLMGPYDKVRIDESREKLVAMEGKSASPSALPVSDTNMLFDSVLRRGDVMELFDTVQDLSGGRTDASMFIRTAKRSLDVDVFWRSKDKKSDPHHDEVCSIPISHARQFIHDKGGKVFDHTADKWIAVYDALPSQTIMLDCDAGGYSSDIGWNLELDDSVDAIAPLERVTGIYQKQRKILLDDHTQHVTDEASRLITDLDVFKKDVVDAVVEAARYHDIGKTHQVFQRAMIDGGCPNDGRIWAKSPVHKGYDRPGFRHEAASALAYLAHHPDKSLTAYLIAAHHGKVRLSLRSVHPNTNYLLGLLPSDRLPAYDSSVVSIPETELDLSMASLGRYGEPSWADMATQLLAQYCPFKLAYLEMVVRAADWVASGKESRDVYPTNNVVEDDAI